MLKSKNIYVGKEGVAAYMELVPGFGKYGQSEWFRGGPKGTPHITLQVAPEYQAKALGPMVASAMRETYVATGLPGVEWSSSEEYLKITVDAPILPSPSE